jgi:hypothetical protein
MILAATRVFGNLPRTFNLDTVNEAKSAVREFIVIGTGGPVCLEIIGVGKKQIQVCP